jgi:hypothetical protein
VITDAIDFGDVTTAGDAPFRQCLRCGALIGGWSFEIGTGEDRHRVWHEQLDAVLLASLPPMPQ